MLNDFISNILFILTFVMHLHIICYVGQCWGNQLYANPGMANKSQHKYSICPTSKSHLKPT